jgi:hypothetical protein
VIAMKTHNFFGIGIGIAMSFSAWAEEPMDPAAVASIDAMLATCREVNPGGKAAYDILREAMVGKQPESALAALAQTPEYQQAYEAARQKAAAEPRDSARKGCIQLAATLGPGAHHGDKSNKTKSK